MKTMMRCLVVVLFVGTISTQVMAQWVPTNGFGVAGNIQAIIASGANIFAGTNGGVFLSTNNGSVWNRVTNGLSNTNVSSLASFTSRTGITYTYAGTSNGLFCSTNSGESWTTANNPNPFSGSFCLINIDSTIFLGTYGCVFRSSNNGTNWITANIGLPECFVATLAVSGSNLIAGTQGLGIYFTTDKGTNWISATTGLSSVYLYVSTFTTMDTNLFAGTNNGVLLSSNNGKNWKTVGALPDKYKNYYVQALIASGSNLVAGTRYGIFVSTNNGTDWTAINSGLPIDLEVNSFVLSGGNLFAGTSCGVYLSTNNGMNWNSVSSGLPLKPLPYVSNFLISENNLFAGTAGGVFTTTNNGDDWILSNNGLPANKFVRSLAVSGVNIYAGTDSGFYYSSNNGTIWTGANTGLTNKEVNAICKIGMNLFAGTSRGIFVSKPSSPDWTKTTLDTVSVTSLGVKDNNIFAGTDNGLFLSTNSGDTWKNVGITGHITKVMVVPQKTGSSIIFACEVVETGVELNAGRICRSSDNGVTWVEKRFGRPIISLAYIDSIIIAGFPSDGTLSMNRFSANITTSEEWGMIMLSKDYGETWTGFGSGLPNANSFSALAFAGNYLYCGASGSGSPGNGVWRRPLSEMIPTSVDQSSSQLPEKYFLLQNYPNPFNPSTTISFSLPAKSFVTLKIFDVLGKQVSEVVSEELSPGSYSRQWNVEGHFIPQAGP